MIDKIKRINNPLTVIAIFAGLAEISSTVALANMDKELQIIFVWFVMLFPTLLVILFFVTLNVNPKVLYAPSDFTDESNFVGLISRTENASEELGIIANDIEKTRKELIEMVSNVRTDNKSDINEITGMIDKRLKYASANVVQQRGNVFQVAKTFKDFHLLDIREWPNEAQCPKCDGEMLKTDDADYHCQKCGHYGYGK